MLKIVKVIVCVVVNVVTVMFADVVADGVGVLDAVVVGDIVGVGDGLVVKPRNSTVTFVHFLWSLQIGKVFPEPSTTLAMFLLVPSEGSMT